MNITVQEDLLSQAVEYLKTSETALTLSDFTKNITSAVSTLLKLKTYILPTDTQSLNILDSIVKKLQSVIVDVNSSNLKNYQDQVIPKIIIQIVPTTTSSPSLISLSVGLPILIQSYNNEYLSFCPNCAVSDTPSTTSQYACDGNNLYFISLTTGTDYPIPIIWYLQKVEGKEYYTIYNLSNRKYLRACSGNNCVASIAPGTVSICDDATLTTLSSDAYWTITPATTKGKWEIRNVENSSLANYLSYCVGCLKSELIGTKEIAPSQPLLNSSNSYTEFSIIPLLNIPGKILPLQSGTIVTIRANNKNYLSYCHNCSASTIGTSSPYACDGDNVVYIPLSTSATTLWYLLPVPNSVNTYNIYNLQSQKLLQACSGCVGTIIQVAYQVCNNIPYSQNTSTSVQWSFYNNGNSTYSISNSATLLYLSICHNCISSPPNTINTYPYQPIVNTNSISSATEFTISNITP